MDVNIKAVPGNLDHGATQFGLLTVDGHPISYTPSFMPYIHDDGVLIGLSKLLLRVARHEAVLWESGKPSFKS